MAVGETEEEAEDEEKEWRTRSAAEKLKLCR